MNKKTPAQPAKKPSREKRDFFRVSQDVYFDYKAVETFAAENHKPQDEFEDSVSLSLLSELRRLDRDSVQTLRLLTEKNRLLGDYLQTLSSKIDLIASHSLFSQDATANDKPKTRINLSEDGMAFMSERTIYKGSYLAVRLIFLPKYVPVTCYSQVTRCEQKEDKHQVAVRFCRLTDSDRQEFARQILKAQVVGKKPARS
ncbi:MAG: hypothetical protein ACI9Y1_002043 [Lentisphaeria bacterium]|jgi:hypothetical protein